METRRTLRGNRMDNFDKQWDEIRDHQKQAIKSMRWIAPLMFVAALVALAFVAFLVKWVIS